jgi:hypothetical protein
MSKRYITPQSGPIDIKTNKDSHTPRTWHTEAAVRQNKAYTPTTEEVCECWTTRNDIGNPYEPDADFEERHHEESTKFDRWLRKVKAKAWREGWTVGWGTSHEGWNSQECWVQNYEDAVEFNENLRQQPNKHLTPLDTDNPYESEKTDES